MHCMKMGIIDKARLIIKSSLLTIGFKVQLGRLKRNKKIKTKLEIEIIYIKMIIIII